MGLWQRKESYEKRYGKGRIMMKHILETECVTKEFRGHPAVNGMSLQVSECYVYELLGPNGAGKSTILKILTGILRLTSGWGLGLRC